MTLRSSNDRKSLSLLHLLLGAQAHFDDLGKPRSRCDRAAEGLVTLLAHLDLMGHSGQAHCLTHLALGLPIDDQLGVRRLTADLDLAIAGIERYMDLASLPRLEANRVAGGVMATLGDADLMIDLRPGSAKLVERSRRIVMQVAWFY